MASIKMIFSILVVGIYLISKGECWQCGDPMVKKIGCFKQYKAPFNKMELLFSDRDNIRWGDFKHYMIELVCRCAKAASKRNYGYFAIRFWGECVGGKLSFDEVRKAKEVFSKRSKGCFDEEYKKCADNNTLCVGTGGVDHLYSQRPGFALITSYKRTTVEPTKTGKMITIKPFTTFKFPTFPPFPDMPKDRVISENGIPMLPNGNIGPPIPGNGFPPIPDNQKQGQNGHGFPPIPDNNGENIDR